ncbi:Cyclic di-GMP phosphodiesterase response regulator RpfG [Anatilimnocola aggregata]|uniref:Cyclic di-GMP phosphodiesterase response regulator RpfG n=1 Tax=Anatilimnocola aggregata TaxID=2528021 RepID=A0A517Y7C4_9BACT|nr:HD domain-containing phosphohydrolase [Anatilimnocola aggregata]QDU26126.1 Cyclic di-GMP phosphodiesterase response regulator RpfG [Anatilimnocola aggregata]
MLALIVDDDEIALAMLEHTLKRSGFEVITASNGREALETLRQHPVRLVISDWDMPGMTGLELCRAVRSGEFEQYIYFVLLTSHRRNDEIVQGLAAGADDFIVKPFHPPELILRVRAGERILGLETRDVTIFALARLAESRDTDTGEHLERVQKYCGCLARYLYQQGMFQVEIDREFIHLIQQTSPLHDIGKVGIPDAILLKPGRFTPEEFDVMKRHTKIGADTLQAALDKYPGAKFLRMARDIALTHHEKFDGTGYPQGLAGKDIPLCGRIVAVADVYDALTTKRVYKDAFPHEQAVQMIGEQAGRHFDPQIVDAFLVCSEAFREINLTQRPEAVLSTYETTHRAVMV